jgi:hypothetical protein
MKKLFIPCEENNYHPILIRTPLLSLYLIFILLFNIIFINVNLVGASAAVDFTTIYNRHNEIRLENGLQPLAINSLLISSAKAKADAMMATNCWSHYCPDGKSPWEFFDSAGYIYSYAGENLAEGFDNNEAVVDAWMNSPTHRDNILNPQFNEIGIAFAYGNYQGISNNTIIVVHFGSRFLNDSTAYIPEQEEIDPDITIDNPSNGDFLNDPNFEISGKANDVNDVELFSNGESIGSVPTSQGNYTYRSPSDFEEEKEYLLQAKSTDSNGNNVLSNIVNFQMDFTAPELSKDQIYITKSTNNNKEELLIVINDITADLCRDELSSHDFDYLGKTTWQLSISDEDLYEQGGILIQASDKAGNTSQLEMSYEELIQKASSLQGIDINNLSHITSNPRLQINVTFSIFLSILFGLDYYMLDKSGNTGKVRSKSHLNFVLFIIVLILSLLTNIDGSILTGLST